MSTVAAPRARNLQPVWQAAPLVLGLLAMYVPTFIDVARVFWANERGTIGPIVMALIAWMVWEKREELARCEPRPQDRWYGGGLFAFGLFLYVIGRSQDFHQFDVGSLIPVLAGCVLYFFGMHGLRALWFPLLFVLFLVPVPGSLLDAILIPLKQQVSIVAEWVMHGLGFPVGRTGVVLTIGFYQLLIADACSGLNSMVALGGVGLFYCYIAHRGSRLHVVLLLASILPIAFTANIMRVCLLMAITYHYGDEAGHAFHDHAGYFEIIVAHLMFFAFDWCVARVLGIRAPKSLLDPAGRRSLDGVAA